MALRIGLFLIAAAALEACAGPPRQTATEADFGKSTASLIKTQTANPATLSSPSTEPVTGVDPDYAGRVIEAMRESVAKPEEVSQPIQIRVGGQSQGGN